MVKNNKNRKCTVCDATEQESNFKTVLEYNKYLCEDCKKEIQDDWIEFVKTIGKEDRTDVERGLENFVTDHIGSALDKYPLTKQDLKFILNWEDYFDIE